MVRIDKYKIPKTLFDDISEYYELNIKGDNISLDLFIDNLINEGFSFEKYGSLNHDNNKKTIKEEPKSNDGVKKVTTKDESKKESKPNDDTKKTIKEEPIKNDSNIPSVKSTEVVKEKKPSEVKWGGNDNYKPYDI